SRSANCPPFQTADYPPPPFLLKYASSQIRPNSVSYLDAHKPPHRSAQLPYSTYLNTFGQSQR
ncbi:MAG: hypothetical protein IJO46_08210, partial [Thermoguttaceae bacterium]|nr:hypothetical protein [Thermoguttaceae bacterium]